MLAGRVLPAAHGLRPGSPVEEITIKVEDINGFWAVFSAKVRKKQYAVPQTIITVGKCS